MIDLIGNDKFVLEWTNDRNIWKIKVPVKMIEESFEYNEKSVKR